LGDRLADWVVEQQCELKFQLILPCWDEAEIGIPAARR
jgi:hypothetical protein